MAKTGRWKPFKPAMTVPSQTVEGRYRIVGDTVEIELDLAVDPPLKPKMVKKKRIAKRKRSDAAEDGGKK